MLKLLDTGWVAYKFGKWRWLPYFAAGLVFMVIGWAITEILMIARQMGPTAASTESPIWPLAVCFVAAFVMMGYSIWLCYIDEARGDYIERAEAYRTHGW